MCQKKQPNCLGKYCFIFDNGTHLPLSNTCLECNSNVDSESSLYVLASSLASSYSFCLPSPQVADIFSVESGSKNGDKAEGHVSDVPSPIYWSRF